MTNFEILEKSGPLGKKNFQGLEIKSANDKPNGTSKYIKPIPADPRPEAGIEIGGADSPKEILESKMQNAHVVGRSSGRPLGSRRTAVGRLSDGRRTVVGRSSDGPRTPV